VSDGAFVIVEDIAPAPGPNRVWRLPVTLLGLVLVLIGVGALVPLTFVLVATVFFLRLDGELTLADDVNTWLTIVGLAVAGYLALRIGVRLLRGRRRSALFLRRFGFTDATRVLSEAVTRGLGRRWRLITLDDLRVVPVGLGRRSRLARAWPWLLAVALVVLVLGVLPPWFDAEFDRAVDEAVQKSEEEGAGIIASIFTVFIVALVVAMVLIFVTLTPLAIGAAVALFGFGARFAVRRAEGRRAVQVDHEKQVERAVRKVEQQTTRIYSPRLTVVRCAHGVWQAVVRGFADLTDVTLIDVSEASPGLLWELTELGPALSATWVLVGRHDRLKALLADTSPDAVRLKTLLDGQSVLAYRTGGTSTFPRALQARLTHVR